MNMQQVLMTSSLWHRTQAAAVESLQDLIRQESALNTPPLCSWLHMRLKHIMLLQGLQDLLTRVLLRVGPLCASGDMMTLHLLSPNMLSLLSPPRLEDAKLCNLVANQVRRAACQVLLKGMRSLRSGSISEVSEQLSAELQRGHL